MRDFPIDFAHMIGVEGDPKISDGMASYAIINGVVTCKKMPALSLAKRDRIPKSIKHRFGNFQQLIFSIGNPTVL